MRTAVTSATFPLIAATLLSAAPAAGQTILVTTAIDSADAAFRSSELCGSGAVGDLPGQDGQVSLREALAAANGTSGPQEILFAASLNGQTIQIAFDGDDEDSQTDPLPRLCDGGTTIDGDIDGDGSPDVTIDGRVSLPPGSAAIRIASGGNTVRALQIEDADAAIVLRHAPAADGEPGYAGNIIADNVLVGGRLGIAVQAGGGATGPPGRVTATRVENNVVRRCSQEGISVVTLAPRSVLSDVTIRGNDTSDNDGNGISVLANAGIADSVVERVFIEDNAVRDNGLAGIRVCPLDAATNSRMAGITVSRNAIRARENAGLEIIGGACRATDNYLEITIDDNDFDEQSQGIDVFGGSGCGDGFEASGNRVELSAERNRVTAASGSCWNFGGGLRNAINNEVVASLADNRMESCASAAVAAWGGILGADRNTLTLTVLDSRIENSGRSAISAAGGAGTSDPSDDNVVSLDLEGNESTGSVVFGHALAGVIAGGSRNRLTVSLDGNRSCDAGSADLSCHAAIAGDGMTPVTDRSGNVISVSGSDNALASTDFGGLSSCRDELTNPRPCSCPGDCSEDRAVTVDEIILAVNIALGVAGPDACRAADADASGAVTVDEILTAVTNALSGC